MTEKNQTNETEAPKKMSLKEIMKQQIEAKKKKNN